MSNTSSKRNPANFNNQRFWRRILLVINTGIVKWGISHNDCWYIYFPRIVSLALLTRNELFTHYVHVRHKKKDSCSSLSLANGGWWGYVYMTSFNPGWVQPEERTITPNIGWWWEIVQTRFGLIRKTLHAVRWLSRIVESRRIVIQLVVPRSGQWRVIGADIKVFCGDWGMTRNLQIWPILQQQNDDMTNNKKLLSIHDYNIHEIRIERRRLCWKYQVKCWIVHGVIFLARVSMRRLCP